MKTIASLLAVVAIIAGGWYIFAQSAPTPTPEPAPVVETPVDPRTVVTAGSYAVASGERVITWEAEKPLIPGYVHRGTISLSGGTITVGTETATGTFAIDMNTVAVTSLGGGKEGKESVLEEHLKKSDFFDVAKYPEGRFEITAVEPVDMAAFRYTIRGTLTLKGKTNPVEFPATIYVKDGALKAEAELAIDRTKWGVSFGSKSVSDKIGDNMIDDTVKLTLNITARQ